MSARTSLALVVYFLFIGIDVLLCIVDLLPKR
jgi:hypothetical protein